MVSNEGHSGTEKPNRVEPAEALFARLDPRPKLLLGVGLQVQWHSPGAERLLKEPLPVTLVDGELRFPASRRANGAEEFLENVSATPERCLLRARNSSHWVLLNAWTVAADVRTVAVVCTLSVPYRRVAESGMAEALALTNAETRVLDCFARLCTPKEIASELDVSVGTVRSHLKQIYSKTGVETAVQLLQLTRGYCFQ